MKKVLIFAVAATVIATVLMACDGSKPVLAHPGVIRLHILANSDSDADQSLKLAVRDHVLKDWGEPLSSLTTTDEAWTTLNGDIPAIKKDIEDFLKSSNADYGVKLETGIFDFPDRDYNGVTFPSGNYRALRIELGTAKGHNWWCVMFPPLCLLGDGGDMDMQNYVDLVKKLDEEGLKPDDAPRAPVRSWFYDNLFGEKQWDKMFLQWVKDNILGGDGK